jgi:hypothetical protein
MANPNQDRDASGRFTENRNGANKSRSASRQKGSADKNHGKNKR